MTKEEFIDNYSLALGLKVYSEPNADTRIMLALIGSIYDQQQMIEYLDNRIIDLERMVYAN